MGTNVNRKPHTSAFSVVRVYSAVPKGLNGTCNHTTLTTIVLHRFDELTLHKATFIKRVCVDVNLAK